MMDDEEGSERTSQGFVFVLTENIISTSKDHKKLVKRAGAFLATALNIATWH